MAFDPAAYGPEIASILSLDGNGERLMPLARTAPTNTAAARAAIEALAAPPTVQTGLYLYFSLWDEAHETAQNIAGAEGSYWHAIVHRQEPDAGNSDYWFRQVGRHPIFPALREQAAAIGVDFGPQWNPSRFVEYCEQAREHPGGETERRALETQRAEWQLLFDYCAQRAL
jgi:hypothetical protein